MITGSGRSPKAEIVYTMGFPSVSDGKESTCSVEDLGLIRGLGRSPGGGHGNPLQYSCPENPMARGAWWATVPGVTELNKIEQLGTAHSICLVYILKQEKRERNTFFSQISRVILLLLIISIKHVIKK